jgi:hypothetical protein
MRQKFEIGSHPPIKYLLHVSLRKSVIGILSKNENSSNLHTFSPENGNRGPVFENFGFLCNTRRCTQSRSPEIFLM